MDCSDEILIDRGDLSREISISSIPRCVFNILDIAKTNRYRANIATNVLDTMNSQLPSRAEISDVYSYLRAGAMGIVRVLRSIRETSCINSSNKIFNRFV